MTTHTSTDRPSCWRVVPAIHGRGEILVGPDPYATPGDGAMAVAPPGVLLRTPAQDGEPLSRAGWREARWAKDAEGRVMIDQSRPIAHIEVPLAQVVEDVAEWAPEQLEWIASIVERRLRLTLGRMAPDARGRYHQDAEPAADELFRLRRKADESFAPVRLAHPDRRAWYLQPKAFAHLVEAYLAPIRVRHEQQVGAGWDWPGSHRRDP